MSQHSDELIKLRAALAPFARRADFLDPETDDSVSYWHPAVGSVVTAGDLRRARAVLDEAAKPAPGGPKMREGWQPSEVEIYAAAKAMWDYSDNEHGWGRANEDPALDTVVDWYLKAAKVALIAARAVTPPEPAVPEVPARVDGEGE